MFSILSIDGGGIKGLFSAQILFHLEETIKNFDDNKHAKLSDYFDFIAGTSTGGLLTCLLLFPDENNTSKSKYSAGEIVNLYLDYGKRIFKTNKKFPQTLFKILDSYDTDEFEKILKERFKNVTLSQLTRPCLITSYDIKNRKAKFFTQDDAKNPQKNEDFFVTDILRASTAAPHYFKHKALSDINNKNKYFLIDGGMVANNPSMCAYVEVIKAFKPDPRNIMMLSLGNINRKKSFSGVEIENVLTNVFGLLVINKLHDLIETMGSFKKFILGAYLYPILLKIKYFLQNQNIKQSELYSHCKLKYDEIKSAIANDTFKINKWDFFVDAIVDILMSANSETVDYQLKKVFKSICDPKQYYRLVLEHYSDYNKNSLNVDVIYDDAITEMDNVSDDNLDKLKKLADEVYQNPENKSNIESYAYQLIVNKLKFDENDLSLNDQKIKIIHELFNINFDDKISAAMLNNLIESLNFYNKYIHNNDHIELKKYSELYSEFNGKNIDELTLKDKIKIIKLNKSVIHSIIT